MEKFDFLNEHLIKEFRDKANECLIFKNAYNNFNGRNMWNVICSAMDWISVTARGIKCIEFKESLGFADDYQSLLLMQYIVAVDVLVESILQLYRAIYGSDKNYPLKNDKTIFMKTVSDDLYFKHLRAAFSTHPINLKSLDGTIVDSDERFFASWSTVSGLGDKDFSVYLYSNKPDKTEMYELGANFCEINGYCKMRYDLLGNLKKKIEELNREITNKLSSTIIIKGTNSLDYVSILMEENYKRIGRYHGYWHELVYLNNMFIAYQDCSINDKRIDCYITFLNNQIDELAESLQDMSFSYSLIRTDVVWTYEVEKIYTFLDEGHPIGEKYFRALIDFGYLPKHLLNIDNKDILKLFFDAYNFFENQETRQPDDISAILKKINDKS